MKKKLGIATLTFGLAFSLVGCGQLGGDGGAFDDIGQLKQAFEKAGGSCLQWNESNNVTSALQSGDCNSETVLMLFGSSEEALERAEDLRDMSLSFGFEPNLLVGENWLINSNQVESVQPAMGGTLMIN